MWSIHPVLPVSVATLERVLDEEQRDGVRLRLERRRGSRVAVIDLAMRQAWSFVWMYDYVLAGTADGDLCFVPRCDAGPVIEIAGGALIVRRRGTDDDDRHLSLEVGERFLPLIIRRRLARAPGYALRSDADRRVASAEQDRGTAPP